MTQVDDENKELAARKTEPVPPSKRSKPPPSSAATQYVGATIDGRYVVEAPLGEGGMGVVYRARHKVIDKKVAIKILRRDMGSREKEVTERFLMEAKAASSIGNPHIVDISDFGTMPDGATYFVMEFLDGRSLASLLGKPVPIPRILHVGKQIALGLAAAHDAGIVHRDMKPDNVMLVDRGAGTYKDTDFVKILDFGIAKVAGGADGPRLTKAGEVFGTPHYMSPEQAAGTPVDQRTDIYALGVILYEMASGKVPFDAENFMGILTQHMYKAPVPIRALVPPPGDVPPGLDAIVLKCLSKKPEQRYASMAELAADLEKVEKGKQPDAVSDMMGRSGGFNVPADYFRNRSGMPEPVPATPAGVPTSKRWPLYAVMIAVASVALLVLALSLGKTPPSAAKPAVSIASTAAASTPVPPALAPIPAPEPAPEARQILIGADPGDAHLFQDGRDLGEQPVSVSVKSGEKLALVAKRAGYKDQTVSVDDASDARVKVKLQPAAGAPKPRPAGKPAAPAPATDWKVDKSL
jgi:serine/threonine-protein kinase